MANPKSNRAGRAGKGLALVFFLALVVLAALELLVRLILPAPDFHNIDIVSYGATYSLSDNPRLIYVPKPNSGNFNAQGCRGPVFPLQKSAKKRIVFMGDSVVEGFRVPLGKRFTDVLNEKMGDKYECINLGVRGYDLLQEVEYFKVFGRRFSPDIVFFGITFNDLTVNSGEIENLNKMMRKMKHGGFYAHYFSVKGGLERLLMHSHLFRRVRLLLASRAETDFGKIASSRITDREVQGALAELKAFSEKDGFSLVFVFLPVNTDFGQADKARLRTLVAESGIPGTDLDAFINERFPAPVKQDMFVKKDPCHLSAFGHQAVAGLVRSIVLKVD